MMMIIIIIILKSPSWDLHPVVWTPGNSRISFFPHFKHFRGKIVCVCAKRRRVLTSLRKFPVKSRVKRTREAGEVQMNFAHFHWLVFLCDLLIQKFTKRRRRKKKKPRWHLWLWEKLQKSKEGRVAPRSAGRSCNKRPKEGNMMSAIVG